MRSRTGIAAFVTVVGVAGGLAAASTGAQASTNAPAASGAHLVPGDLLVSTSTYVNDPNIVAGKTELPPGSSAPVTAIANGNYPQVFNNVTVDPSFGITSPLYLNELSPSGKLEDVIPVPTSDLVTSFSSKSEGALNLSSDGKYLTFMGYVAKPDTVDVSNSNTPGVIDSTNPVPGTDYRAVASLSGNGLWNFTETNAYSGNNGSYTAAAASTTAGLQKWVFNKATGQWQLAYTLRSGLKLGTPYTVKGYPTGTNSVTSLPWAPATDGLRNITGKVNANGTVTIYAVTSTVSGGGDEGADPNALVAVTDKVGATSLPSAEKFATVVAPRDAQVVRGVSFTPGTK